MLSLRVALASGELIDTVAVPRHAVGPDLTQLFVGTEGTLGIITRATLEIVPLPAERRFVTLQFPDVDAGIEAFRRALAAGHRPSVIRMYDEEATARTLSPRRRRAARRRLRRRLLRGRGRQPSPWRGPAPSSSRARRARASSTLRSPRRWWDRRYEFYKPPHHPELPSIWGTIDVVATYTNIVAVHEALKTSVRDRYADRGPPAADALLALVPLGHDDLRPLPDPGRRRRTRSRCTTRSGRTASRPSSRPAA